MDKQREDRIQHVFDSFCRRVLKNAANDYYDEIGRRSKHEVPLEDCWILPLSLDSYFDDAQIYTVFDTEIPITNCLIIDALNTLSVENRVIVLAACCIGLPDRIVAERLHLVRRTVAYRKARAISELRRVLADG